MNKSDLFVVTAPSGTGKTTLIRKLLGDVAGMDFSVSFTTRPRRKGEMEGRDYHFVDDETFEGMIRTGDLLEWAKVHGHLYGTSAAQVDGSLARGMDILLDVDTQGAASVKKLRPEAVMIFIMPPDLSTLEARLRGRGLESAEEVERRLNNAFGEIQQYSFYDYVVINDTIQQASEALRAVVLAHRVRGDRQDEACRRIVGTFRRD